MKIRNPNIEIRNKSEGVEGLKKAAMPPGMTSFLKFKTLFPFVSDFGFRISDFPHR